MIKLTCILKFLGKLSNIKKLDMGDAEEASKRQKEKVVRQTTGRQPTKRCGVCPREADRKTSRMCQVCKIPCCAEHSKCTVTCNSCDRHLTKN